jgi:hypothetical protein
VGPHAHRRFDQRMQRAEAIVIVAAAAILLIGYVVSRLVAG